jgi:hypothetical protein
VASIVVSDDVVLLLENRRQRFNHSIVVRGIVREDAMKSVTQIVLVERVMYNSSEVLTTVVAEDLFERHKWLVKNELSINIMPCDSYKKTVSKCMRVSQEEY